MVPEVGWLLMFRIYASGNSAKVNDNKIEHCFLVGGYLSTCYAGTLGRVAQRVGTWVLSPF